MKRSAGTKKAPPQRTEAALQASEERYRLVFENTGTAMAIIEPDMTISMVNSQAAELYGATPSEIVGRLKSVDFAAPRFREQLRLYHEMRNQGDPNAPDRYEFQIIDRKDRLRDVIAQVRWIPQTRQTVVSLLDISERKQLERDLHRLAEVIEQSSDSILITDMRGTVAYVNKSFEAMSGLSRQVVVGQSLEAPFFSEQERRVLRQMTFMVSARDNWSGRAECRGAEGRLFAAELTIFPVCDAKGKATNLVCIRKDVTHEAHLEKQLQHAQKMEAIGTLAGGIAHDFNNILAGILGFTELSQRIAPPDERLQRNFKRILEGCQRAKQLIQHILTFSRRGDDENKPLDIKPVVKETLKLLRASIPATVEFRQHITAERTIVSSNPTHIHQVVMNLCTNAAQAMEEIGGELEVGLVNVTLAPDQCQKHSEAVPGEYVCLTVKDTGIGMDPQTLARIFEPYFTTKAPIGGTGLGLAVVHGIVKSLGGTIEVTSEPGQGSVFKVCLPCTEDPALFELPAEPRLPIGNERILVVDDESFILEIVRDMLKMIGYHVETAHSVEQALQCFCQNPANFDLAILDWTMPKMNGLQLAERIIALRPEIPMILCTGKSMELKEVQPGAGPFKALLTKPIQFHQLAAVVRSVLDAPD